MAASAPRFSHLRAGDLATLHYGNTDVPVKVLSISGTSATVEVTASRPAAMLSKGNTITTTDNLRTQNLTTRTKSGTTLLVF